MCAARLIEALNDCLINFDSRVLLTNLINEYHMPLEEVSRTLADYLSQQEKGGVNFEKRYLVHGTEPEDSSKEVFQIVNGEDNLNEWLKKLKDSEFALYSVEVEGGTKSPAEDLKPVQWSAIKLDNLETRKKGAKQINANTIKSNDIKAAVKVERKTETIPAKGLGAFTKTKPSDTKSDTYTSKGIKREDKTTTTKTSSVDIKKNPPQNSKSNAEADVKKTPQKSAEQKKISPKDKKAAAAIGQKGIGNFFTPKSKDQVDSTKKVASGVIREKSPKKLNEFFKNQTNKSAASKETLKQEETKANTSTQLFAEDESEDEEQPVASRKNTSKKEQPVEVLVESSDEEEELNKLRRKLEDAEKGEGTISSRKRLRIEDSDDEDVGGNDHEEPQQKQEKMDESVVAEVEDSPPKSETYLDEDGFVITIKSKKTHTKPPTTAASRQKTPTKLSPKAKKARETPAVASKSKQGNIMNFFKKK